MKKELRPVHDAVSCDVCGRTILKGERAEWYLAPGGHRRQVCDLCAARAQHHGWIRESGAGDLPARMPRHEPRRGVLGRLRRRRPAQPAEDGQARLAEQEAMFGAGNGVEPDEYPAEEPAPAPPPRTPRSRPQSPRQVRAVPTTAEVKVERALELFNQSEHVRTIAGIAKTLGEPWVSAAPLAQAPAEVSIVVAWELSWYRFRVDLGDAGDPVTLVDKGQELEELDEGMREWNGTALADGRLAVGVAS